MNRDALVGLTAVNQRLETLLAQATVARSAVAEPVSGSDKTGTVLVQVDADGAAATR